MLYNELCMISLAIIPEYSSLKTGKTGKIVCFFFLLSCHIGKGNVVCMVLKAMVYMCTCICMILNGII